MKKEILPETYEKWTQKQLATELWYLANQVQNLAESIEAIANALLSKEK